jgi:hypothetical protein
MRGDGYGMNVQCSAVRREHTSDSKESQVR